MGWKEKLKLDAEVRSTLACTLEGEVYAFCMPLGLEVHSMLLKLQKVLSRWVTVPLGLPMEEYRRDVFGTSMT